MQLSDEIKIMKVSGSKLELWKVQDFMTENTPSSTESMTIPGDNLQRKGYYNGGLRRSVNFLFHKL